MKALRERISIVVLTYNRAAEVIRTLSQMVRPNGPQVIVVDNASQDGTEALIKREFPDVRVIRLEQNIGAAARNVGVRAADTPYVAFCDDDTWWEEESLERASELMDGYSRVAVLNARVLVGSQDREDPTCALMDCSPLPSAGLPGKALLGFMAGACVVRRNAYMEAGGYEPKFFLGGEEALLAFDLISAGWALVYMPQLTVHHYPSRTRAPSLRRRLLARNALWVAWMRLPLGPALRQSLRILFRSTAAFPAFFEALRELPWVMRHRKVLPPRTFALYRLLERT